MIATAEPAKIEPAAIYTDRTASLALATSATALAKGRRDGSLRFTRRGGRIYYTGEWILAWLLAGEVRQAEVEEELSRS